MKLNNDQLGNFIKNIKLHKDNMQKYRDQVNNLKDKLEKKIKEDEENEVRVMKYLLAGSWKKHTILRPSGDYPIDIDLVLFVEGVDKDSADVEQLHDFIVEYLEAIYPQKDINRDVDAEGKTKAITIRFIGTGLEVDIVPVIPLDKPKEYVWQPQRGGGGDYITSISKQLAFSRTRRRENSFYSSIVRAVKWWRNYQELGASDGEPGLSSYAIELLVAYLDINKGVEENIEEGIIRFFLFLSSEEFSEISFVDAINKIPIYNTPIFIADDANNENNVAKKMNTNRWEEIKEEALDAFEILNSAQARNNEGDTIKDWKEVFGPSFKIK